MKTNVLLCLAWSGVIGFVFIGGDVEHLAGGAVGEPAELVVVDGVAELDLVACAQPVGAAGGRQSVVAEFCVLVADGLGAGVELVEVLV